MRIDELITRSTLPRLEAEMLMALALEKNRSWIMAHEDDEITEGQEHTFNTYSERRKKGEPMSYITGIREFYGREFIVTHATLIPRPATESLIDIAKQCIKEPKNRSAVIDTDIIGIARMFSSKEPETILDIGTGSGCIAITLALEGVKPRIIGVDTSLEAIKVAKKNACKFHVDRQVTLVHESGESAIRSIKQPFLIVSNPPYIPMGTRLEHTVAEFEPHSALFAGDEGMDVITTILSEATKNPHCVGVILECRKEQESIIDKTLSKYCQNLCRASES